NRQATSSENRREGQTISLRQVSQEKSQASQDGGAVVLPELPDATATEQRIIDEATGFEPECVPRWRVYCKSLTPQSTTATKYSSTKPKPRSPTTSSSAS